MTTVETQPISDVQPFERAVFVTDDNRRAKLLRRGAFVTAALACLWLAGLGVGMFGFGSLPGISMIKPGGDSSDLSRKKAENLAAPVSADRSADSRRVVVGRRQTGNAQSSRASRSAQSAARPIRTVPVVPVAPPAQQPVNPTANQRGWARTGLPAPPGQVRKTEPQPPPGERGQRRGQTTTPTMLPPVPPGQVKKTETPPPPEG